MRKYKTILLAVIILLLPASIYAAPDQEYIQRGGSWLMALLFAFLWLFITGPISWSFNIQTKGKRIIAIVLTTINSALALTILYTLIKEIPQQRNNDGFWVWELITSIVIGLLLLLAVKSIIKLVRYYK